MGGKPWYSIIQIERVVLYYLDKAFYVLLNCFRIQAAFWGRKKIEKIKQNKKSNTTFSSNTIFNLISSSPFSLSSDNHSFQGKEAGMEFELNSKRMSQ